MSAKQLEEFQHGFDLALAALRTPELWSAASLVHEAIDPHAFDGFAAWLLMQGRHACERARSDPDAVIAALTRTPSGKRRRPDFSDLLELPRHVYGERFDRDLYERVKPPKRPALVPIIDDEPDEGETWTHPFTLEQRFPKLWRAFATRSLRVFPWIEEEGETCNCCGRVHRYGYGLLARNGHPLGSYTLHWVDGQTDRIDSMQTFAYAGDEVVFATRHLQYGSSSGMLFLDPDDAPFQPERGRLLGSEEAKAHELVGAANTCALAVFQREPRFVEASRLWMRRSYRAQASAERVAKPQRPHDLPCSECGKVHAGMELSHLLPDALTALDGWEWRHRVDDAGDLLTLDGRRRFQRGLLPVAVAGRAEPYRIGVWVELLDPSRGSRDLDGEHASQRLQRGACALIANDLLFLPQSSMGLEVSVQPREEGMRPEFILDACEHPLFELQRDGMTEDMPQRLLALFDHD
jgi:hypothetical protein